LFSLIGIFEPVSKSAHAKHEKSYTKELGREGKNWLQRSKQILRYRYETFCDSDPIVKFDVLGAYKLYNEANQHNYMQRKRINLRSNIATFVQKPNFISVQENKCTHFHYSCCCCFSGTIGYPTESIKVETN
jgi:hypothetical protein